MEITADRFRVFFFFFNAEALTDAVLPEALSVPASLCCRMETPVASVMPWQEIR
jgi:hypothetical protein